MEPYIGEIRMFGGSYAPEGWAMCNGQLISISESETLFALLGTTYGGDGVTTFALPDMRGRLAIGAGANYNLGGKGGVEEVTLLPQQLPVHGHAAHAYILAGNTPDPTNAVWAMSDLSQFSTAAPDATMQNGLIAPVGGNQPHDNMMPSLSLNYIIALVGIWPSEE
jgi:microcystin-dependent protein